MALRAQMEASRPGSKHQLCHPLAVRPQVRQDNYSSHLKGLLDDEMLDAGHEGNVFAVVIYTLSWSSRHHAHLTSKETEAWED